MTFETLTRSWSPRRRIFTAWICALVVLATVIIQGGRYHRQFLIRRQQICIYHLEAIDRATKQLALYNPNATAGRPKMEDLVGGHAYFRKTPMCPSGGEYTLGAPGERPTCSEGEVDGPFSHRMTMQELGSGEK